MFDDPLTTCAVIAAVYSASCVACFFIGRHYQRNKTIPAPPPSAADELPHIESMQQIASRLSRFSL